MEEYDIIGQIMLQMENDKWNKKFKRWLNLQFWLAYCLITNNRICRYFKYRNKR